MPTTAAAALPAEGLTREEAARRLAEHGPNELVPERPRRLVARLLAPLAEPMPALLLGVGLLYLLVGQTREAVVMLAAVVPIVLVDHALELRMERTLAALRAIVRPTSKVVRDGAATLVPSREIVPGDLVLVEEGDVVAADARLVRGSDVLADESSLTGESAPVAKEPGALLRAGSTLVLGRGAALVEATGAATGYGKIGALVASIAPPRTPLQLTVDRLVRRLVAIAAIFVGAVVALQLARGSGWVEAVLAGASLMLAAAPEEFPLVFTLFLSLGALRMARHKALVRRWAGVEALGSTTVVCCDKTGTLTEGKLALARSWTLEDGELETRSPAARTLLERALLASEPEPYDPLEKALFEGARSAGIDPRALAPERTLVKEHAFVRTSFRMSHVWREPDGRLRLVMKGSLEGVLAACRVDDAERARAESAHVALAARGMKVLAVASRPLARLDGTREEDESQLALDGLVAFHDPPRAGVREALASCAAAGVRVLVLTGDHPTTARAIGAEVGLASDPEAIATGDELAALSDAELAARLGRVSVVARAAPEQKHAIVRALRKSGESVAMTGDGVNDAPALKEADVGIAMGRRGTDVARAAATMVLLDDAFPTIVVAIEEGRRIYDNIRKSFLYLIAFHVPILLLALVVPLLGWPLLLLPVHMVLLELVVHPLSAIAFEAEPPEADAMARPPRRRDAPILALGEAVRATELGLTVSLAAFALYALGLARGASEEEARGLALGLLVLAQIGLVLGGRGARSAFARGAWTRNRAMTATCAGVAATLAAVFSVPLLLETLKVAAPAPREWLILAALAAASTLWPELLRRRGGDARSA